MIGPQLRDTPTTPCKLWEGAKDKDGYGVYRQGPRVHRVEWMKHYGVTDLQVNHLCLSKNCYEITHIYAGTQKQNFEDMIRDGNHHWTNKTECPKGHQYDEENTVIHHGSRECRTCNNARNLAYAAVNKEKKKEYDRERRNAK